MLREPFFLAGDQGDCFCLLYRPNEDVAIRGKVLVVPPFAEELNKSRRIISLLASALADDGYVVLLLDLYGTGDSEGSFQLATWDGWISDVVMGVSYLHANAPGDFFLVTVRLGALLALLALEKCAQAPKKMIAWQPIWCGDQQLNQFLKITLAAKMFEKKVKQSVSDLRRFIIDKGALDVSGYVLTATLMQQIDQSCWDKGQIDSNLRIQWIDVMQVQREHTTTRNKQILDAWEARGVNVSFTQIVGAPFWNSVEIEVHAALRQLTISEINET